MLIEHGALKSSVSFNLNNAKRHSLDTQGDIQMNLKFKHVVGLQCVYLRSKHYIECNTCITIISNNTISSLRFRNHNDFLSIQPLRPLLRPNLKQKWSIFSCPTFGASLLLTRLRSNHQPNAVGYEKSFVFMWFIGLCKLIWYYI